jgi:hypothetical protein
MKKRYPMGNYGLSIILAILFLCCWGAQSYFGWVEFQIEEKQHGQVAKFWGMDGYTSTWMEATMENWQSEFLQLLSFVVLTSFLIHKGSHESKDSDDETAEQLNRIEQKLDELQRQKELT